MKQRTEAELYRLIAILNGRASQRPRTFGGILPRVDHAPAGLTERAKRLALKRIGDMLRRST